VRGFFVGEWWPRQIASSWYVLHGALTGTFCAATSGASQSACAARDLLEIIGSAVRRASGAVSAALARVGRRVGAAVGRCMASSRHCPLLAAMRRIAHRSRSLVAARLVSLQGWLCDRLQRRRMEQLRSRLRERLRLLRSQRADASIAWFKL
jgi:hypothetical protein